MLMRLQLLSEACLVDNDDGFTSVVTDGFLVSELFMWRNPLFQQLIYKTSELIFWLGYCFLIRALATEASMSGSLKIYLASP